MNEIEHDALLAALIEHPSQRERLLGEAHLGDDERKDLLELADTAEALWRSAQGAPAIEDDPVAAMLGLVPDARCQLDSARLKRVRKRSRLTVSDVATQLQLQAWDFDKSDVLRWETRGAPDVVPAVVQSLADIFGSGVSDLIAAPQATVLPANLAAVRANPLFERLVARWAEARHVSEAVAVAALESRMVASVHRGGEPDPDQLLGVLDALVRSIEKS